MVMVMLYERGIWERDNMGPFLCITSSPFNSCPHSFDQFLKEDPLNPVGPSFSSPSVPDRIFSLNLTLSSAFNVLSFTSSFPPMFLLFLFPLKRITVSKLIQCISLWSMALELFNHWILVGWSKSVGLAAASPRSTVSAWEDSECSGDRGRRFWGASQGEAALQHEPHVLHNIQVL